MSPDIQFGEHDGQPLVTDTLFGSEVDEDGNAIPLDLTGRTVVMRFWPKDETSAAVDQAVVLDVNPTTGGVTWTASPVPAANEYNANWIVDAGLSTQITVPNGRYLWMHVMRGGPGA